MTAKVSPYKEGIKLSQALESLERLKNQGYIDPDLYGVFVRSDVFRRYAKAFLKGSLGTR